jgi:hypothetical protein
MTLSPPCPSHDEARAYVRNAMPTCDIIDVATRSDKTLDGDTFEFVTVAARYVDDSGDMCEARWSVWNEPREDGSHFIYGEW